MESSLAANALTGFEILIISCAEKNIEFFSDVLTGASIKKITVIASAGETRRTLIEKDFDIVIIDAPLADESGETLARHIAVKGLSQVILAVNSEHFNAVCAVCQDEGILTISKPLEKNFFWSVLSLAGAVSCKLKNMQAENAKLKQKIEDIRIIDKAKCILISYLNLTEQEAHRFIEKQAMDLRSAKRTIAEKILKTYAN